ncbi:MAG: hypothetical protein K6A14_05835, partial [Erysipelotrichaceae bacterium]|nr:hypothetical protein [Erysipelotrichaceae bacterium]
MKLLKVLLLIILLAGSAVSVCANSALMYWQGSESGEVYMLSAGCPVTVSHEKLVFNISQLPDRG